MIPTVTLHLAMWFMPESPGWLAQWARRDKALEALAQMHSNNDINDPFVHAELAEIEAKIRWKREHPPPNYVERLVVRDRRRTWLGIGVVGSPSWIMRYFLTLPLAILATSHWCERVSLRL